MTIFNKRKKRHELVLERLHEVEEKYESLRNYLSKLERIRDPLAKYLTKIYLNKKITVLENGIKKTLTVEDVVVSNGEHIIFITGGTKKGDTNTLDTHSIEDCINISL